MSNQNEPLVGGSYVVDRDGKRTLKKEPTRDHPEGNRAREKDGTPMPTPTEADANPQPAPAAPAKTKKGAE